MHTPSKSLSLLTATVLLAALGGCGKQDKNTAAAPLAPEAQVKPSLADMNNPKAVAQAVDSALPKGDPTTPLANYRKVDSGNQVMFEYYALSNMPVPYDDIAQAYSTEYRSTDDSFKRKDIITALKPRIDQEISNARSARYVMLEQRDSGLLERYNFEKKTFAIKELATNDRYTYFNDNSNYTLATTNAPDFSALSVPDEAKARAIEGYLSKYAQLRMEVYAFAQDADPSNRRVKLQVMKVRLYSPSNELLAEI
jgi:hypothetical protein